MDIIPLIRRHALGWAWMGAMTAYADEPHSSVPPAPPPVERPAPKSRPVAQEARSPVLKPTTSAPSYLTPLAGVSTWRERAEDVSAVTLTPSVPSYPVVQSTVVAEGTNAFHMAHPSFEIYRITLDPVITPTINTYLFFESQLRYATANQIARAEVSDDGGTQWNEIWSRTGTGDSGQPAFELVSVSLGSYAGQDIRVRFNYDYLSGPAFTQTNHIAGWFIDDIQIAATFEPRAYTGFGEPTPEEVLSVEYINRARTNAMAEATRLKETQDPDVLGAISQFNVDLDEMVNQFGDLEPSVQPLAINERLTAAARLHNEDMWANVFQGHDSSTNPPTPHQPGDNVGDRATYQGYSWQLIGENVFARAKSVWYNHAAYNIDWGTGTWHGMQSPPGHREAIHNPDYREIGMGILEDSNTDNGTSVGPMITGQILAESFDAQFPFLVGVTYADADGDNFYSVGEGLGGATITVAGAGFFAVSSTHGAYAVPMPGDGTYDVTFHAPGYLAVTQQVTVTDGANRKADYVAQADPDAVLTTAAAPLPGQEIRMEIIYGGTPASLIVQESSDLETWTTVSAVITDLGGGLFRVDATPASEDVQLFRVIRAP